MDVCWTPLFLSFSSVFTSPTFWSSFGTYRLKLLWMGLYYKGIQRWTRNTHRYIVCLPFFFTALENWKCQIDISVVNSIEKCACVCAYDFWCFLYLNAVSLFRFYLLFAYVWTQTVRCINYWIIIATHCTYVFIHEDQKSFCHAIAFMNKWMHDGGGV